MEASIKSKELSGNLRKDGDGLDKIFKGPIIIDNADKIKKYLLENDKTIFSEYTTFEKK